MVQQSSRRSGFSPSWWSSSSHTSLSCFLNKVTHKPDNNKTERPFCLTSFILHEMLKKSGCNAEPSLEHTQTYTVINDLSCHIQGYQTREGSPSPPRQQSPIRKKGFSNPVLLSLSPTLVILVPETVP